MKRMLSLMLVLAMVLSLFAGCGSTEGQGSAQSASPNRTEARPEEEYERAVWYGFVPEELSGADPDETVVTWEQYCNMLGSMIRLHDEEEYNTWQRMVKGATDAEMKRDGAMVSLLFAAKTMGYASFNAEAPSAFQDYAPKVWEFATMDYPVFDWNTPIDLGDGCSDNNHVGPAYDFSLRRVSLETGKSLLEFDEADDLRLEQPLTLREAALSVIRLYESEVSTEPVVVTLETMDEELLRAYNYGLVPEEWLVDMGKTVTIGEFNRLLTKIVEMRSPKLVPEWESVAEQALTFEEPAQRDDAVVSIYEAAVVMGIHETRRSYVHEDWEAKSTAEDWWEGRTMDYDYFPNWGAISAEANGVWYAQTHVSQISQNPMFLPTETWTMGLGMDVTREDAARALARFVESEPSITDDEGTYLHISDVGDYDQSILPQELLEKASGLPEVTHSKLPESWKGIGISAKKSFVDGYLPYEESDVKFIAESGCNFVRLFLGFSTFRYPDYPGDSRMVNEDEFKELDQLLAWCMEYGVHLQIAMSFYLDENGDPLEQMPRNEEEWAIVTDYWTVLARRYVGIGSKYLTFDLSNEIEPWDGITEGDKAGLRALVEAMRAEDPNRVLLYSQASRPQEAWTEFVASLGVSIECHPYFPEIVSSTGWEYMEKNPYLDISWPQPYFPIGNFVNREAPIEISGEISGATLRFHIHDSGVNQPVIGVYGDGKLLQRFELEGQQEIDGSFYYFDTIYSLEIPEGTQTVRMVMENDYAFLDTILIEKDGVKTNIIPTDAYGYSIFEDPLPLIVKGNGTYTNSENLMCDEDLIYEIAVKPYREIAEKYGVGFMIGEFGVFGTKAYWDIEDVMAYYETYLNMLEKYDLPWCCCELENTFPKHFLIMYGDESQWTGATVEDYTITLNDGSTETVKVCKELLDTFTKYTLK